MQWRRIDLHLHTPGSKDYAEPGVSYLDILHKAEAEGLDIIGFTDHNTVAGYAAMMQEIHDLERWEAIGAIRPPDRERLEEYKRLLDKILVLPGFEFTAMFGFHILALFDPKTPLRAIEHVLIDLDVPINSLELGEVLVGATTDVISAYEIMAKAGALVIAAHANSSNGVAMIGLGLGGQTKIAFTQDLNLHALEVTDLETKRRRTTASFFNGSKPEYPRRMHCIQGSDSHRVQGVAGDHQKIGVGERATEVLIPEVSFEALLELFKSNHFDRTRPYRQRSAPFDYVEAARKEGPSIVQSFHESMSRQGGRLHAILRDVVAFANTQGGTIYIGLSHNLRQAPVGVESPQEAMDELHKEIDRLITPQIEVSISDLQTRGVHIIRIEVPQGLERPYALEGSKIYLRRETETSLAMRDELVTLMEHILKADEHPVVPTSAPKQASSKQAPRQQPKQQTQKNKRPSVAQPVSQDQEKPEEKAAPEKVESDGRLPSPKTGVQIVNSEERDGMIYHTMRDLRDGGEVNNVTHSSARRLWRYAIALEEKGTFQADNVKWQGDLGLWHRYKRAGRPHFDLVQRTGDDYMIYYGVSEDGIHGPWRQLVGQAEQDA